MKRVVVVGNGPAAHRFVEQLRLREHAASITVFGAEERTAYNRLLLGKVLNGTLRPEDIALPALQAEVRTAATVTGIDRRNRAVETDDGWHPYDLLVLATGARPRIPDIEGSENIRPLHAIPDAEQLSCGAGRSVAVLGGDVRSVQAALTLRDAGYTVTLVTSEPHLMRRQLDAAGARALADQLADRGVAIRLDSTPIAYRWPRLPLQDGGTVTADVAVTAESIPDTRLADSAGLDVRRGIVVDESLCTSDPHIAAIGDCSEYEGESPGRIEVAWQQAETLASLLTGGSARYRSVRPITRLSTSGIDITTIGSLAEASESADVENVTLSDSKRGRYASLMLSDERVRDAVLVGFPQASATITQLYDRDSPLPAERLPLLLGNQWTAPVRSVESVDVVICDCNNVTERALVAACEAGARTVGELAKATRATTGCGGCAEDVGRVRAAVPERR